MLIWFVGIRKAGYGGLAKRGMWDSCYTYLRINHHSASQVHELTPRLWKERFASSLLRSELFTHANSAVE
jgi:hypothetical protein